MIWLLESLRDLRDTAEVSLVLLLLIFKWILTVTNTKKRLKLEAI
jgi:hypothetical protein